MDERVLSAALAGLLDGVERLAQVTGQTLPEGLPKSFTADTLARLSLAQHLIYGSTLNMTDAPADWPYLQSVFNRLHEFNGSDFLRPKRLAFEAIRSDKIPAGQSAAAECALMGPDFVSALQGVAMVSEPRWQIEALLDVMQNFGWAVAAGPDLPDVSLFNQTRVAAALAAALAADERLPEWCAGATGSDAEICALVLGDVNGVQDFIYSLASRGAAKTLRGRSFYVQLLTEVIAEYILDQLHLPLTNLLYAGGGNFYLLIGAEQSGQLAAIRTDVTQRLNIAHEGALNMTLGETVVKAFEFRTGQFATAWSRLHTEVSRRKRRPFEALDATEMFKLTGSELGVGGDEDATCSICGSEKQAGEHFHSEEFGGDTVRKCESCKSLEQLGNDLAKATHLIWLKLLAPETPRSRNVRNWQAGLRNFGAHFVAVNAKEKPDESYLRLNTKPMFARIAPVGDSQRVSYIDQLQQELNGVPTLTISRLFAQLVARGEDGRPLTFDEIGDKTQLKRWAVLRMDVDNLGALFQHGFITNSENRLTLVRVTGLSFALRLFFEGLLPKLAEADPIFDNVLYLQYAGGDDVFLVGTWDALPKFALRVCKAFREYVAGNRKVTLSAGISLADLRYPLYQAAEDTEKAEKAAKHHGKNAVTFLNQTLGWDDFMEASAWADQLAEWAKDNQIRKALIQTLLEVGAAYRADRERDKPRFGRWMWMLAYHITRAAQRAHAPLVKEGLANIERLMLTPQGIHTMTLAARWAELASRESSGR